LSILALMGTAFRSSDWCGVGFIRLSKASPPPFLQMPIKYTKLKARLRQNSFRRIPLLTNSTTKRRTSARVRRLGADNSIFYGHPATSTQTRLRQQVCWSNAYIRQGLLIS
jgi:hypothetical protein